MGWADGRIAAWSALISDAVIEDANQGGYPSTSQWKSAVLETKRRLHDILDLGSRLAQAAVAAAGDECDAPTCGALSCFGLPSSRTSSFGKGIPGEGHQCPEDVDIERGANCG